MNETDASLRLLGNFCLTIGDSIRRLATRKAESLLAFLVLVHPKEVSRDKVLTALWPDIDEARARRNLSTTLWRVQKALEGSQIRVGSRSGWLWVSADALEVDVTQFRKLVESPSADPNSRLAEIEKAVSLYAGDLLESLDEEWCEAERNHLRFMFLSALKELVRLHRDQGAYEQAIRVGRRIVALDPMDEETHRELMLLYHLVGDRSAALAQYQFINNILQAELGISPEARTTELWRYIRSRSSEVQGRRTAYHPVDAIRLISKHPLVGRDEELSRVLDGLTGALHGRGSMLVLLGEVGIGKTKLIETAEVEASLRGFEILKGRCSDLLDPSPYQALIEALWPRISRKMQSDTPQVLFDFLAHLSPAIRRGKRVSPGSGPVTSVINQALLALLDGDSPVFLILEDFQHADHATRTVIQLLGDRLSGRRMMVLLSVRTSFPKMGGPPAQSISTVAVELRLEPLNRPQSDELIRLLLGARNILTSVLSVIWNATAGNPLAVVEYLRFLVERGYLVCARDAYWTWAESSAALPQLPPRIQTLLRERVSALGAEARALLTLAAVLGYEGDLQFLERLSGLGPRRYADVISQLFDCGLLKETSRGYQFAHESYRLASLSTMTGASRRLLHAKIAGLMEHLWPARSEDLAWHFMEAGRSDKALPYAEASADKARAVYATENALKWYTKALELLNSSPSEAELTPRRISLLLKRQEVLELLGRCSQQIEDLNEIVEYAAKRSDRALNARCHCLRARSLGRMNRNVEALEAAAEARRLYKSMNDPGGQARSQEITAMIHSNLRNARGVRVAYEKAMSLFRLAGDREGMARVASGIGTLMLFTGQSRMGLACLERAEATLAKSPDRRDYAPTLIQKGVFWRYLGRADRSERYLVRGIELLREQGDRVGEARGLSQLACTHVVMGSPRNALHEARRSIRLATEAGDTRGQIVFRNNAAYAVYRCLGQFGRAQRCVREALSLVSKTARKENQAIYYDTMAAILCDKGDYPAAYQWAKEARRLYKRWLGQFTFVGAEIDYHLGASALALGRLDEALSCLGRAIDYWERSHDAALLPRGLALLGLAALEQGDLERAAGLAERTDQVLRRIRGAEEVQRVYWAQAQIYRACGRQKAMAKAIGRAHAVVMNQADLLKGRLRQAFLSIPANKRILEEAEAAALTLADRTRLGVSGSTWPGNSRIATPEGDGVAARRERLLTLIRRGHARQRDLAVLLGVSVRTVRSDIATLRGFGLLPHKPESLIQG